MQRKDPPPVFKRANASQLVSPEHMLAKCGKAPVNPSKVIFAALERSVAPGWGRGTGQRQPADVAPLDPVRHDVAAERALNESLGATATARTTPDEAKTRSGPDAAGRDPAAHAEENPPHAAPEEGTETEKSTATAATAEDQAMVPGGEVVEAEPGPAGSPPSERLPQELAEVQEAKPEKYQLPGSLVVNIQDYKGSLARWGLMVILDDSVIMIRDSDRWAPNRMEAAARFVAGLPRFLTEGSRLAVRDFYCKNTSRRSRRRLPLCLSHLLFDWSGAPFHGLKDRLERSSPGGRTNPCAAAAFSLRKDFPRSRRPLIPRILLVTAGRTPCAAREVLQVINRLGARGIIHVDVVGVGLNPKKKRGYAVLAGKTKGVFVRIGAAREVDEALKRYERALKTPTMTALEIQGEKANFRIGAGQEITLAPGEYDVVLPDMPGLDEERRTIKGVKIESGHNRVLSVRLNRGHPIVSAMRR